MVLTAEGRNPTVWTRWVHFRFLLSSGAHYAHSYPIGQSHVAKHQGRGYSSYALRCWQSRGKRYGWVSLSLGRTEIVGNHNTGYYHLGVPKTPFLFKRKLKPGDVRCIQVYIIIWFELVLFFHLVSNFIFFCPETRTLFLGHTGFYVIYQSNSCICDVVDDAMSAIALSSLCPVKQASESIIGFFWQGWDTPPSPHPAATAPWCPLLPHRVSLSVF